MDLKVDRPKPDFQGVTITLNREDLADLYLDLRAARWSDLHIFTRLKKMIETAIEKDELDRAIQEYIPF